MIKEQELTEPKAVESSDFWTRPPVRMAMLDPAEVTADLAEAIAAVAKLPVEDQNYLAYRLQEEMADEKKWTDSFANSVDLLDKMAADALQEDREGKTRPLEELL